MCCRFAVVVVAACCIFLGACRGKEAAPPNSTPSNPPAQKSAESNATTIRASIHPSLPEYSITVIGEPSSDAGAVLRVKKIEIRRGAESKPVQVIDGLNTATPLQAGALQLSMVDMNFDGYNDIHLMELQPAGPNIPYLNWLFEPSTGRFVESPALNAITSPQFDPKTREIRSEWRDGPTRYGSDIYVYQKGEPVLVRKETKEYRAPGNYTLQISRMVNGGWKVIEQREVKEN